MKFFGTRHAGGCAEVNRIEPPVGAVCAHCVEPIREHDDGFLIPHYGGRGDPPELPWHRACFLRGIVGSVAHQQKRCSCYMPGSTEGDDPALTVRQAAEAALTEYLKSHSEGS